MLTSLLAPETDLDLQDTQSLPDSDAECSELTLEIECLDHGSCESESIDTDAEDEQSDAEDERSDEDDRPDVDDRSDAEDEQSEAGSENSWDDDLYPPLELNYDALKHVASYYLPGGHGKCIGVSTIQRGASHEIRVLHFEDGWTCVGRFTRNLVEPLHVIESQVATTDYIRKHTKIPAPETYYVNTNPNHAVGAAFVLMEQLPGTPLYKIWDDLSTEQKKTVLNQIADVIVEQASLHFDHIGCLMANGKIGPLRDQTEDYHFDHPFADAEEYLRCYMPDPANCTDEMNELNQEFKEEQQRVIDANKNHAALSKPYRLIHTDSDAQNIIFTEPEDPSQPPLLSGVIDWDYSYTGLLYELIDHPIFIQDIHWSPEKFAENKILRGYFVRCLAHKYPKGSEEREQIKECFRMKDWLLSNNGSMWADDRDEVSLRNKRRELEDVRYGDASPYDGVVEWEPDSELESESEEED